MDIICLQNGTKRTSAFLMPTVAGSVTSYFELAKALGPGHGVYGIQCAERDQAGKFRKFASLQGMASEIGEELAARHAGIPICLIGYSFGAALALEVAQQLVQRGNVVPLVAMIDRMPQLQSAGLPLMHTANNLVMRGFKVACRIATEPKTWGNYCHSVLQMIRRRHPFEGATWFIALTQEHQDYVRNNLANLKKYRFAGEYSGKILF
jgi:hypothetical protein